jgi:hypothetical protein
LARGALDRPDHVGDTDVVCRPGEPVAALDSTLAVHEPGVPQLEEDVLEELEGGLLLVGASPFNGPAPSAAASSTVARSA